MGGFFGAVNHGDAVADVFFGTDYHSHLGTARGGMAAYDPEIGLQRDIHNIQNSPFRTKFEHIFEEMQGTSAIGCISDADPQPLLIRSKLGTYAICMVGVINNAAALIEQYFETNGAYYSAMTGGRINSLELLAALISQRDSFAEGIRFAQQCIEGSASILILTETGNIIAARDLLGRTPVEIGQRDGDFCASFESFACQKLGYEVVKELGPGEIVELSLKKGIVQLTPPGEKMRTDILPPPTRGSTWKPCATATVPLLPSTMLKPATRRTWTTSAACRIPVRPTPSVMPIRATSPSRGRTSNTRLPGREASHPRVRWSASAWPR